MSQPSGARPRHASADASSRYAQEQPGSARPRPTRRAPLAPTQPVADDGDLDQAPPASAAAGLSTGATMATTKISSRTAQATRHAQAHAGAGRGARRARETHRVPLVAIIVMGAILVVGIGLLVSRVLSGSDAPKVEPGLEAKVTIPDGAGGEEISSILLEAGVISDASSFFKELRAQEAEMSMKSGTYEFLTGSNVKDVVSQLTIGPNSTADSITVPEGYTVRQIAALCESKLLIPVDDFMARAKASNYVNDFPFLAHVQDDSLEGYLFPKTYDFGGREISADLVIRTMLSQYQTEIASLDFAAAKSALSSRYGVTMTDYDLVTMASIIEKEASLDEERADVASVFYNRMQNWMPLQSDATIGYVVDHQVTAADLEIDSPYNTYLYAGLTPTPVCNPGIESLRAALTPNDTNYFYFLLIDDGTYRKHVFSETYDDHLRAIDEANADRA